MGSCICHNDPPILVKNLWSPESPGPGEIAATRAAAGHAASRDVSHSRRQKGAQAVLRPGRPSGFHTGCFEEILFPGPAAPPAGRKNTAVQGQSRRVDTLRTAKAPRSRKPGRKQPRRVHAVRPKQKQRFRFRQNAVIRRVSDLSLHRELHSDRLAGLCTPFHVPPRAADDFLIRFAKSIAQFRRFVKEFSGPGRARSRDTPPLSSLPV